MTDVPWEVVDSQTALVRACDDLASAGCIYLDTEFEARREGTRLCLVQASAGNTVYLVDPLRLAELGPLRRALGGRDAQWVVHAGAQDVSLLLARLGIGTPPSLFDTQVAWALLGPEYSVSLAYLQFRVLGVRSPKAYQTDDWTRRPLPEDQLAYAAGDVAHLPALHARLGEEAARQGRTQAVLEASAELLCARPEAPAALSLESFRNAWQLGPASQAALRFLIEWYASLDAAGRAEAPEPKTLLAIANRMPETASELDRIKGVSRRWSAAHGDHFVGELARASKRARSGDFVPIDPPPYATFEEIRLEAWLQNARAEICATLQVAPELALPGRLLRRARGRISRLRDPRALLDELSGWRRELLADHYVEYCTRTPPPL